MQNATTSTRAWFSVTISFPEFGQYVLDTQPREIKNTSTIFLTIIDFKIYNMKSFFLEETFN